MPVIYKITSPTCKIYIGQTWHPQKRIASYKSRRCKSQTHIYNSIKKYGWENHTFEIIELLDQNVDQSYLDSREVYWWNYFKNNNYEMLNIKEPGRSGKHSKETLEKLSTAAKGRVPWNKGIKYPKELAEKMTKQLKRNPKGWKMSEEAKKKISKANKGKKYPNRPPRSEETKQKLSLANKGKKLKPEHLEKMKKIWENNKGRKCSNETKDKMKIRFIKPFVMLDLNGNFIKEFNLLSEAALFLNVKQTNSINFVLKGFRKTYKNYQFIWKKEYDANKNYKIAKGPTKLILQYDKNDNFIKEFLSTMEAERELQIKFLNTGIVACCKGKRKSAAGFKWRYKT